MQFNEIVEKLKQGQSGVVDFKIKNNPDILTAAKIATESGIKVQLADGRAPKILGELLDGKKNRDYFPPSSKPYRE